MTDSQELATAAALNELKIGFTTVVTVAATVPGMPASSVLHAGDVITAVDGTPVSSADRAASLIRAHHPGAPVELTVSRNGQVRTVRLVTKSAHGQPAVGIVVSEQFKFPFPVQIRVGDIGGPSAGMMFALGLVDKLSPDDLAAGRFIAGTGEIDAKGNVSAIGGIQQKMVGARNQGATIFLAPASNCPDVRGSVPPGLRIVKVSTLGQAVQDLQAINAGKAGAVVLAAAAAVGVRAAGRSRASPLEPDAVPVSCRQVGLVCAGTARDVPWVLVVARQARNPSDGPGRSPYPPGADGATVIDRRVGV